MPTQKIIRAYRNPSLPNISSQLSGYLDPYSHFWTRQELHILSPKCRVQQVRSFCSQCTVAYALRPFRVNMSLLEVKGYLRGPGAQKT